MNSRKHHGPQLEPWWRIGRKSVKHILKCGCHIQSWSCLRKVCWSLYRELQEFEFFFQPFIFPKMVPIETESTWGKIQCFLEYIPSRSQMTQRLEQIKNKIDRNKVFFSYLINTIFINKECSILVIEHIYLN